MDLDLINMLVDFNKTHNKFYIDLFIGITASKTLLYYDTFDILSYFTNKDDLYYFLENIVDIKIINFNNEEMFERNHITVLDIVNFVVANNKYAIAVNNFYYLFQFYKYFDENNKLKFNNMLNYYLNTNFIDNSLFSVLIRYISKEDFFNIFDKFNLYKKTHIIYYLINSTSPIYKYDINDILILLCKSDLITDNIKTNTTLLYNMLSRYCKKTHNEQFIIKDYNKDCLQMLINKIDISLLFNQLCGKKRIYIIAFLNLFKLLFDEKMEYKYIKKLKNKKFYTIVFLTYFNDNYCYKYPNNKKFVEGLIFMSKLTDNLL